MTSAEDYEYHARFLAGCGFDKLAREMRIASVNKKLERGEIDREQAEYEKYDCQISPLAQPSYGGLTERGV